jgi:hypothetical protein
VEREGDAHVESIVHTCSAGAYAMEGDTETLEVTSAGSAGRWRGAVRQGWWTCVVRDAGEGGENAREAGEQGEGAEGVRCRLGGATKDGILSIRFVYTW